jgi:hypothetical protein
VLLWGVPESINVTSKVCRALRETKTRLSVATCILLIWADCCISRITLFHMWWVSRQLFAQGISILNWSAVYLMTKWWKPHCYLICFLTCSEIIVYIGLNLWITAKLAIIRRYGLLLSWHLEWLLFFLLLLLHFEEILWWGLLKVTCYCQALSTTFCLFIVYGIEVFSWAYIIRLDRSSRLLACIAKWL